MAEAELPDPIPGDFFYTHHLNSNYFVTQTIMINPKIKVLLAALAVYSCFTYCPSNASALTLTKNTVWQGEIKITEDILVPRGVTLTVKPDTKISVVAAESTKTDPEYLSPLTEITIRGTLNVEGTENKRVEFSGVEAKAGSWAGIIVDHGTANMHFFRIRHAETALQILDSNVKAFDALLTDNRYGMVAQGGAAVVSLGSSRVSENDYGLFNLGGTNITTTASVIANNRKTNRYDASRLQSDPTTIPLPPPPDIQVSRHYGDEAFRGDVVWQGRIEVGGIIRVPQGSRLIIMPGTIVEFLKRDTDGDGIGENGILIQGRIIAKGTKEQPIVFRSAEHDKRMGDWDSINIMDSAGAQNLIEFCRIEHAYRGLHFHFSNVAVHNSMITNNYRGIQFQESQVDLTGNYLFANKSGIQGRDSDLIFDNNVVQNNYIGANFFRTTLVARGNSVVGNWKEGWRIREGVSTLQENLVDGNRQGLLLADMFYGNYSHNSFTNNLETGLALKSVDNVEVSGNIIAGNGLSGLIIQESRALIKGNQITDNGERGVGVQAFYGLLTENNLASNGLYAIDLDGPGDVTATTNWWGGVDPAKVVLDKRSDPSRGNVIYNKPAQDWLPFVWPLQKISTDAIWRGIIAINQNTYVSTGAELRIIPKTTIMFAKDTGLLVKGKMIAAGEPTNKIIFTSQGDKTASYWGEVQLEYATGSVISNCLFEYATWGLHSHFTNLSISDSQFTHNFGGLRFRSGPVVIKHSVFDNNSIGIRAYLGNAVIKENLITKNETGIFVREKGGGLTITRNNIFENSNYNIRIGDFNNENVLATDNWWGAIDPLTAFFDARSEPGIGNVLFEPYLKGPVKSDLGIIP